MKKHFIKVLIALAFSQSILFTGQAQNAGLNQINNQLRTLFINLNLPPNPKLFLYDMSCHMTDSNLYQTNCKDTIDTDTWYRLYEEMYYSAYDTLLFEPIEDVYNRANSYYGDTVPIGLMNYDYYKLKDDALTTANYFDFDTLNNTISDKNPRQSGPYRDSSIFSAAPLVGQSYFSNPTFRIDPSFFFYDAFNSSNFGSEVILQIDFGDGMGFIQFSNNSVSHHNVTYPINGAKNIRIVIQSAITNQIIASSNSQFIISTSEASIPPDSSLNLPGLNIGVYNGCNSDLTSGKLVIYLAGFDIIDMIPSYSRTVERVYSEMISNNRIVQLKNQGYTFVVVDYDNSRIDMRFNALYVLNLLEKLKCTLDMEHQFVIMGESMGGLIARYTLTYMETEFYNRQNVSPFFVDAADPNNLDYLLNNPSIFNLPNQWCMTSKKHNTRLLITLDSPHQGANIPISMQYMYSGVLKFFGKYLGINAKQFTTEHNLFLDGQAAQQMLIYHVDTKSGDNYYSHPDKISFFQQLDQLGDYPEFCKVTALSNGSLSGESQTNEYTLQPRTPGDRIADMSFDLYGKVLGFKVPLAKGDLDARTNPNGYGRIYTGNARMYMFQIKLYWVGVKLWMGYTNIINHNAYASAQAYCTGPGGYEGDPTLISNSPSLSQTSYKYEWMRYLFDAHMINTGNGCGYAGGHAGFKGIATINLNFDACTDGMHFALVPVQSALDYGRLGNYSTNHDIEAEPINTKLGRVKPSVIIGYPGYGNHMNKKHLGYIDLPFRNSEIFNILQDPHSPDPETYYSCIGHNTDVKRGLLNLEIGDEELYLENAKLAWHSLYQAEYDIHVNDRNPYYEYPSSAPSQNRPKGMYSKENPYIISQGGNATFLVDATNSPTGKGLSYNPPFTGTYQKQEEPLGICCIDFIGSRLKKVEEKEELSSSNSSLIVFPNPSDGQRIILRYKFKKRGKVRCEIINVLGQSFVDITLKSHDSSLENTSPLSLETQLKNGMYFVRLSLGDEVLTERLVIQNK